MTTIRRFALEAPDLTPWRQGNTGTEGVWHFDSGRPGRRVMVSALVHGNELCGAWAVKSALEHGVRPRAGTLTLAFCNLAAFDRYDPEDPDRSRFVDHDLNRLWGAMPWRADGAQSVEHRRVLALQPFVEAQDWLLDLHSMHTDGPPLGLTGLSPHHARQAAALGAPALLVADAGHAAGKRMRDHGPFGDPSADRHFSLLVECGWHGALSSRTVALDVLHRFLLASGVTQAQDLPRAWFQESPSGAGCAPQLLEVTHAVLVHAGVPPSFSRPLETGDCIPRAGTVIGHDGRAPVVTPYDDCVVVMPALVHANPGSTLVRLARRVPRPG